MEACSEACVIGAALEERIFDSTRKGGLLLSDDDDDGMKNIQRCILGLVDVF